MKELIQPKKSKRVAVTISAKSMRFLFIDCNSDYIKSNCKGSCFNSKGVLNVTIAPREQKYFQSLGVKIENGFLQPNKGEKRCPFQKKNGLCKIHKNKPIGCRVSPFNLTSKGTLIIRFRYLCMNCHLKGTLPAYKVFYKSLEAMFGKKESKRIVEYFENGGGDLRAFMFRDIYEDLVYNRNLRSCKVKIGK